MNYWIYYWKDYKKDTKNSLIYRLNQSSHNMGDIKPNDIMWTFGMPIRSNYALLSKMTIKESGHNELGHRWQYYAEGDTNLSQFYDSNDYNNDIESLIREIMFLQQQGKKYRILGHCFQGENGVRKLKMDEHNKLCNFAKGIKLHPKSIIKNTR